MAEVRVLALAFLRRTIDDPPHRELMPQAPSVLGEQYGHIHETVAQPPIERLLTVMAERDDPKADVPVATTASYRWPTCARATNHRDRADPEDALTRTGRALTLLLSGLAADGIPH